MRELGSRTAPERTQSTTPSRAPTRSAILLLIVLILVAAVAIHGIRKGEFNLITDETIHAVTGLYVADFLRDLPLAHPVQYTFRYYAQYPALGLFHWPPFFYLVEAIMFLLLGPSVVAARLTVLAFSLLGFYFWFKLVNELHNEWAAALSTGVLAFLPFLFPYEKAVMLEIPSLALCIAATYFWIRYLNTGIRRLLYGFTLFASLALLTKYQAIYLPVFCLLTVLALRKWSLLFNRTAVWAFGIILLLTAPYYLLALKIHGQVLLILARVSLAENVPMAGGRHVDPYNYYWGKLPEQLGWPLLLLSVAGVATSRWWDKKESTVVMLLWVAACYLGLSFLGAVEPRYMIYWLPPFIYFAAAPLTAMLSRKWVGLPGAAAALVLFGIYFRSSWNYERPYISGYAAVASRLTHNNDSGFILFDGELPGNFIFFMRSLDPERRFFVLRKALYLPSGTQPGAGLVQSSAQLKKFIDSYGIKHIVVSKNAPTLPAVQTMQDDILRELLQTPQFKLAGEFPVETNIAALQGDSLLLYENTLVMPRSARTFTIETSGLNHAISVPLDNRQDQ
jgi:Dolichyl-phosphate-mannose-protein mannosyltransferase